jgi:predicted SAM-dependent methyltransferase
LLCEHVFEHLTESEARAAAAICFDFLEPGGWMPVAVPDTNFPSAAYQDMVKVGGPGPADHPAADHKIVYDVMLLSDVFTSAGFSVDALEFCDAHGRFHYRHWDYESGPIYRSFRSDHRNKNFALGFTSVIIDAHKPT